MKIREDSYKGYLQKKTCKGIFKKPTHKINVLKANIYKFPYRKKKLNELSFGSKIKVIDKKAKFLKFSEESGYIMEM